MSRVCSVLCSLLSLVLCTASLDLSQIQVYPGNGEISEVFIVQLKNNPYSFNATTATDVCTSLGFSVATHAQVITAQRNGLQTCRYGWVMEKFAVIPRTEKSPNCGRNQVGVIVWPASPSRLFDVFCFSSTGQTEASTSTTSSMTTVSNGRTDSKTNSPSFFLSNQLNKNLLASSPSPQPTSIGFHTSLLPTLFISSTVMPMTTSKSQTSLPSSGYQPSSFYTSFSTSFTSTDLSLYPFINSSSVTTFYNETDVQPPSGKGFSFGAVPIACVTLGVMLLMMAGTGAIWYFKIKRPHYLSPWERICHETEMWKHTEQQHFSMQDDSGNCGSVLTLQIEDDMLA